MLRAGLLSLALLALTPAPAASKKPVGIIHMHGVMENYWDHNNFKKYITRLTGLPVHLINAYNYAASLTPMAHQIKDILPRVKTIAAQYDKVIAVGFSQGGLVWRGMIEEWDDHNVDTFISLASPQHGVYGLPPLLLKFLPFLRYYPRDKVYKIAYSDQGQQFAPFNYYKDPARNSIHLDKSTFLPILNNEVGDEEEKERKKKNFTKLRKLVLIGGPGEDVIDPWQSTQFGFYDRMGGHVEGMLRQKVYQRDLFGLKTLQERGSIVQCTYPGITHIQFRDDPGMLEECILPALEEYNTLSLIHI